jgi:putative membrane protein
VEVTGVTRGGNVVVRWLFAALHLLGLGIGLGAVWTRARALRGPLDMAGLRRVFAADAWWGVAAAIWISTGLVRVLAGMEKATDYYLRNHVFWGKMTLLLAILVLEVSPIVVLTRWRAQVRRGDVPDTRLAGPFATISYIQVVLVVLMVLAATAMARGIGMVPRS